MQCKIIRVSKHFFSMAPFNPSNVGTNSEHPRHPDTIMGKIRSLCSSDLNYLFLRVSIGPNEGHPNIATVVWQGYSQQLVSHKDDAIYSLEDALPYIERHIEGNGFHVVTKYLKEYPFNDGPDEDVAFDTWMMLKNFTVTCVHPITGECIFSFQGCCKVHNEGIDLQYTMGYGENLRVIRPRLVQYGSNPRLGSIPALEIQYGNGSFARRMVDEGRIDGT